MTRIETISGRWIYHCEVCGRKEAWGKGWRAYSSVAMDENIPNDVPTLCSHECQQVFSARMKIGLVKVPSVKLRGMNGVKIVGKRIGY